MINTKSQTNKPSQRTILKNTIKIILIAIAIYFVYRQLSENWLEVVNYRWSINYPTLLLSIIMHLVTFILFSKVWCILIESFGHRVPLKYAFKIGYITNLGRYIPGKIWPVIGMSYLAKKLEINEEVSVTSWIVALIFTLPSAFLAGLICAFFSPELQSLDYSQFASVGMYLILISLFLISLFIIFIPNKTFSLLNIFLRYLKRPEIKFKISIKTALFVYFGYFFCWLCYGFAFWLFVSSIASESNIPMMASIGAFIIAYQLGYLAFFAPGGIGVRELILTAVLAPYLGPISAGIAVAARIWNMITEIIAALIAWYIRFPSK